MRETNEWLKEGLSILIIIIFIALLVAGIYFAVTNGLTARPVRIVQ